MHCYEHLYIYSIGVINGGGATVSHGYRGRGHLKCPFDLQYIEYLYHNVCTIHTHTHYTYYTHTLYTHYTHTIHTLYTHTLYTHYTLHTLYTHYTHTIHTLYTHTLYTHYTHYTHTLGCTLRVEKGIDNTPNHLFSM